MRKCKRFYIVTAIVLISLFVVAPCLLLVIAEQRRKADEDLLDAAKLGSVADILSALKSGPSVNAHDIIEQEHLNLAALWRRMISPNDPDLTGASALQCAVRSPHSYQSAKVLIDAGADMKTPNNDTSLLYWAARGGDKETMLLLIGKGANVNEVDTLGFTPLQGAELARRPDLVGLLKKAGAKGP